MYIFYMVKLTFAWNCPSLLSKLENGLNCIRRTQTVMPADLFKHTLQSSFVLNK